MMSPDESEDINDKILAIKELGYIVFDDCQEAIEYGLTNATPIDLQDYSLMFIEDVEEYVPTEQEMIETLKEDGYAVIPNEALSILRDVYVRYAVDGTIDISLLEKVFQHTTN